MNQLTNVIIKFPANYITNEWWQPTQDDLQKSVAMIASI
jgi:hypothetical protein